MKTKFRVSFALALRFAVTAAVVLGGSASAGAQSITEYSIPLPSPAAPIAITAGPDGALWFTVQDCIGNGTTPCNPFGQIGRITTSGAVTTFPVLEPDDIAAGPDGALWFTESIAGSIGRITTSGVVTEYPGPSGSGPTGIVAGPDGALWFTEQTSNTIGIGRITTSGGFTGYPIIPFFPYLFLPTSIVAGSDGALWFAAESIGRITTAGSITYFRVPIPNNVAAGPDGALWFTEQSGNSIGRITTAGTITEYPVPTSSGNNGIATGPDGALWFTESSGNKIGRITTSGTITEYPVPTSNSEPLDITAGPDGALWFTEFNGNKIGRITTGNTNALVAAVLPSSRSVRIGNTATAFATIINSGSTTGSGCAIVPVTSVPASFVYQTTNPATNALTGSPNTPVSIAAGAAQSFVIALTPNAPVVPTKVALGFDCAGVNAATSNTGLNTLLYSASATPVPDIVALAATAQNDGILHITGTSGSNAFAVATVNVGASASIIATATTGAATLPLAISLCQTNPMSGQCISSIGSTIRTTIGANGTPTFAIFATASGSVPFVPQTNRIFVEFSDANEVVRGSTSVAVETQ